MKRRRKARENNLTEQYLSGAMEISDADEAQERFGSRSRDAEAGKMARTALLRASEQSDIDIQSLPSGQVVQVYSLFSEVVSDGKLFQCVVRKTLSKLADSAIVVGDNVRFRDLGVLDEQNKPQAVIEQLLPRDSILTRTDSFKGIDQHPIVANAQQMLIVASLREPDVRWGLVDRMLIAAQGGNLKPIVCLNKADLGLDDESRAALAHYESMGVKTLITSVNAAIGLNELRELLINKDTVLAGHSGVGKSTLINAIEPSLDLRTGAISNYTGKGRHTTTSARRYPLSSGGAVVDTPGVKMFGLWHVTRENLPDFFPDIAAHTAPPWRIQSFERINDSLSAH
ncbi:MAG TPA: ribosome small subunit-dependent GTPase A [Tepidisphaeraceae bacterium]